MCTPCTTTHRSSTTLVQLLMLGALGMLAGCHSLQIYRARLEAKATRPTAGKTASTLLGVVADRRGLIEVPERLEERYRERHGVFRTYESDTEPFEFRIRIWLELNEAGLLISAQQYHSGWGESDELLALWAEVKAELGTSFVITPVDPPPRTISTR